MGATIIGWVICTAVVVLVINDRYTAYCSGSVYGLLLGFYWSTQYSAAVQLLPKSKIGKFTGVFPSLKSLVAVTGTTIYGAVVQRTNDQRLAVFVSVVPTLAVSLVPLRMVDFEKGSRQMQDELKSEAEAAARGSRPSDDEASEGWTDASWSAPRAL